MIARAAFLLALAAAASCATSSSARWLRTASGERELESALAFSPGKVVYPSLSGDTERSRVPIARTDSNDWPHEHPREWFAFRVGGLQRLPEYEDGVRDGIGLAADGGLDLSSDRLRPAFEFGLAYAAHDVNVSPSQGHIDLWRFSFGARLTYDTDFGDLYARAGFFQRWNLDDEFQNEPYDQSAGGWYAGAGVELELPDGMRVGPFFDVYRGARDDRLEERFFGLSARVGF